MTRHVQVWREYLLDSEAKMNDVAVLDDIVFALKSELAGLFTFRLTAQNNKVIVSNHLGTDKSALDVAMNLPCSFARDGSLSDRPGADLVFARRKKTDQIQQPVRRPDKPFPPKPDRPIRAASIHPGKAPTGVDRLYRQPD